MNLIITDVCNRSCPYCFAMEKVSLDGDINSDKNLHMSMENFEYCLDFMARSGLFQLKILGGEPSVHPRFTDFVQTALDRGFSVMIFTNGIWNDQVLEYFRNQKSEKVSFIVNINNPKEQTDRENEGQAKSLAVAGNRAVPSFNIYKEDFDMTFLAQTIKQNGMRESIRMGLACPIVGTQNEYLGDDTLKRIGRRLVQQLEYLEQFDILGSFDCGFPLCMFEEDDLGKLRLLTQNGVGINCSIVIDVGPTLDVWPCFPLSNVLNINLKDYKTRDEIQEFYQKALAPIKKLGSMDECLDCKYLKRGQCTGGCTGRAIKKIEESGDTRILQKLNIKK